MLTGRPPFPGGSLAQKINWHQQATPAAIEIVRRDVPPGLALVVQRMMAKKPQQRYQTPAEVAEALTPFCGDAAHGAQGSTVTYAAPGDSARTILTAPSRGRGLVLGAAVALCLVGLGMLLFFLWPRNRGPNVDAKVEVTVRLAGIAWPADPKNVVTLLDGQPISFESLQKDIKLKIGAHELVIEQEGGLRERREFLIGPENAQQKIVLPETDLPVGLITSLSGHQFEVTSVSFSADGLRLLSVGPHGNDGVFLWDVPSAKQVHHYAPKNRLIKPHPWSGALSPDGHAALIGASTTYKQTQPTKPWVQIVGMESGVKRWETVEHTRKVLCVAFSPDGKRALSADDAGFTKIWNAEKGLKEYQLDGSVGCFAPDGERVLTAYKLRAELWQLAEPPKKLQSFEGHSENIRGVAFAPDGRHVLTCGDATAKLWDANTGKLVRLFKGHDKEVTSAAISPDGRRVLTGSKDYTVRLWDTATGNQLLSFTEHTDAVTSVAYSPGGRRAASGSVDRTVRLWSLPK